jgi:hypothetical protein
MVITISQSYLRYSDLVCSFHTKKISISYSGAQTESFFAFQTLKLVVSSSTAGQCNNFNLPKWLLLQPQMAHFPKYFSAKGCYWTEIPLLRRRIRNAHGKLHYSPKAKREQPNLRLVHPELFPHKTTKAEIQGAKGTQDGEQPDILRRGCSFCTFS